MNMYRGTSLIEVLIATALMQLGICLCLSDGVSRQKILSFCQKKIRQHQALENQQELLYGPAFF